MNKLFWTGFFLAASLTFVWGYGDEEGDAFDETDAQLAKSGCEAGFKASPIEVKLAEDKCKLANPRPIIRACALTCIYREMGVLKKDSARDIDLSVLHKTWLNTYDTSTEVGRDLYTATATHYGKCLNAWLDDDENKFPMPSDYGTAEKCLDSRRFFRCIFTRIRCGKRLRYEADESATIPSETT